jgi:DNA polymerase-3 subunit delta'
MDQLFLHPTVEKSTADYLRIPAHALLLAAPEGSGKLALSLDLAAKLLDTAPETISAHPSVKTILPEKDKRTISIEAIRELQHFIKLKLPNPEAKRLILIPDADTMTHEAQNALLKVLEEPPARTFFILTASREQYLLPTVVSRVQRLEVKRPARSASQQYFATQGFADKDIQQAYLMSGGLVGLMHALLSSADHPLLTSVQAARQLLQATTFERLCKVDELSKQKTETFQTLFMLRQMSSAAIERAKDNQTVRRWHNILQASYQAETALTQNASAKLVLTNLMLEL